ncbi:MAG: hypothetical protein SPLUMA2_SPLUMAMAG2_00916 [uncultured Sulfurimonas sp.]|nr:MAG: hypothetical protein SPLUMA1_SPLUMAMAG1_00810 [uncultured Sulfurimonas sp.]CAI6160723.1 MAG: hypothetical protein SPLUMA2_SPLUMAMAG2_00916 [uncultured Sulfurimonas sp.]
MGILLITLASALVFGLVIFFICEEKSLINANFSDMKGLFTEELKLSECMGEFNTVRYMLLYIAILVFFDLIVAQLVFIPNDFGAAQMMAYIFMPSLVGSWIILLVKWSYQPVIKVISSFMYGAGYIGAAVIAFGITYLTSM